MAIPKFYALPGTEQSSQGMTESVSVRIVEHFYLYVRELLFSPSAMSRQALHALKVRVASIAQSRYWYMIQRYHSITHFENSYESCGWFSKA